MLRVKKKCVEKMPLHISFSEELLFEINDYIDAIKALPKKNEKIEISIKALLLSVEEITQKMQKKISNNHFSQHDYTLLQKVTISLGLSLQALEEPTLSHLELLRIDAKKTVGSSNYLQRFNGALLLLAGALTLTVNLFIPPAFSGISMLLAGSMLFTSGACLFHNSRQKSVSKNVEQLAASLASAHDNHKYRFNLFNNYSFKRFCSKESSDKKSNLIFQNK